MSELEPNAWFWNVVEDCLVEFHGLPKATAIERTTKLRKELKSMPPDEDSNLIYHEEPYFVAADLAGVERTRVGEDAERYRGLCSAPRSATAAAELVPGGERF
jgi:hypothetical protein